MYQILLKMIHVLVFDAKDIEKVPFSGVNRGQVPFITFQ